MLQRSEANVEVNDIFIGLFIKNFDPEDHLTSVNYCKRYYRHTQ